MTHLVFGLLLGFVAWTLVEQLVLWLRPAWLAALSFVPLSRRSVELTDEVAKRVRVPKDETGYREGASTLDPSRLPWPADFRAVGVDVYPPAKGRSAWFRVGIEGDHPRRAAARRAGVGRIGVLAEDGALALRARWFPALLIGTAGVMLVLVGVIVALASWGVALVMSTLVIATWSLPALTVQQAARARIEPALDRLAERLTRPDEKPTKKRKKSVRKSAGRRR